MGERMKDKVLAEVKQYFRPEFLNRIDAQVVFHSLGRDHIRQIVDLMMRNVEKQLAEKQITIEVTDEARDFLGEKGYDQTYGARPLRRVIQNLVEDKLSDLILRCLAKAPGDRFGDAAALRRALEQCACAGAWTPEHATRFWRDERQSALARWEAETLP